MGRLSAVLAGMLAASGLVFLMGQYTPPPTAIPANIVTSAGGSSSGTTFGLFSSPSRTLTNSTNLCTFTFTTTSMVWLPNCSFPAVTVINSGASGNVDLYTVPAGKTVVCPVSSNATNPTGGNITAYGAIKDGSGNYWPLFGGSASTSGAVFAALTIANTPPVFNSGEKISVNMTATGLSLWWNCIQFDNSGALRRTSILTPAAGDNTVFTSSGQSNVINVQGVNSSGGNRTVVIYLVPNGSSASSNNKIFTGSFTSAAVNKVVAVAEPIQNGDFVNFNDDAATATQGVWTTYVQQAP